LPNPLWYGGTEIGVYPTVIVGRESFSRTRQLTSEAGRGTFMLKIKSLILVLVVVLVTSFCFSGIIASAKTTTKKASTKRAVTKKPIVKKTAAKKATTKKKSVKKPIAKKKTAKRTIAKKKKSTKLLASKSRHKGFSRGSGSTIGEGSTMKVISYAKRYLGVNYNFGSSSSKSFDCSGFTMYIYRAAGIHLPHSAAGQANLGLAISNKNELKPGDLVFFQTYKPGISHVGIYIGSGRFIHASSGKGEVTITKLSEAYYTERFRGGTRLLNNY
jgi:cell wall-associated NlpC family hydrolase